jgi:peptidoglycan hydrolase CwlO-like protein
MLKKLAWLGVAALVAFVVVKATGFEKFCGPMATKIKQKIESKIPLEDQIAVIKDQISKLQPDIDRAKTRVAEKRVAVKNLQNDVDSMRATLTENKDALQVRADNLANGEKFVYYGGVQVPATDAKKRLAVDFKNYQRQEALFKSKEQLLSIRQDELRIAQEQLEALAAAQKQAETEVAQLETELMTLRLTQTRSKYQADDSRLADIKQSIAKVRSRIEVDIEKDNLDKQYGTAVIPPENKDTGADAVEAVRSYFKQNEVAGAKK